MCDNYPIPFFLPKNTEHITNYTKYRKVLKQGGLLQNVTLPTKMWLISWVGEYEQFSATGDRTHQKR